MKEIRKKAVFLRSPVAWVPILRFIAKWGPGS